MMTKALKAIFLVLGVFLFICFATAGNSGNCSMAAIFLLAAVVSFAVCPVLTYGLKPSKGKK